MIEIKSSTLLLLTKFETSRIGNAKGIQNNATMTNQDNKNENQQGTGSQVAEKANQAKDTVQQKAAEAMEGAEKKVQETKEKHPEQTKKAQEKTEQSRSWIAEKLDDVKNAVKPSEKKEKPGQ